LIYVNAAATLGAESERGGLLHETGAKPGTAAGRFSDLFEDRRLHLRRRLRDDPAHPAGDGGKRGWIGEKDILEIVAIAESTPGPIAINSATFVGWRVCGFWGAFCATVGVVLPSFVIITAISYVLEAFEHLRAVKYAFFGIRAGVLALILKALVSMYRQCPKHAALTAIMARRSCWSPC
jgi:hypothetical protein